MTTVSATRMQVMKTDCYKNFNPVVKKLIIGHNNMKIINNGLNIARNRGYELFEKEHNFSWSNKLIIKELTLKS